MANKKKYSISHFRFFLPFIFLFFSPIVSLFAQTPVIFSTPGTTTWTVPAGVTCIQIECWGGGGGGGGSNSNTSGGGGGGGGYSFISISTTPGGSYNYSVGAGGGAGGTAYNAIGGTGGTTSVTGSGLASFQATGGVGGRNGTGTATNGAIGANGVGSGGSVNRNGGSGGLGCYSCSMNWGGGGGGGGGNGSNGTTPATASSAAANGGAGGSVGSGTAGGAGGSGWFGTFNNPGPGYAGNAPGGGGGGAGMYNTGTPFVGGAGGNGQVKISWNAVAGCPSVRVPVVVTTTAPVPGTVTGAPASIASGSNVTYTATGFSGGTFAKFQYQWNTTAGAWTDWGLTNPYTWTAGGTGNTLYVRSAILDINGCFAYSPAVSTFITSQYVGQTDNSGNTPATAPTCGAGWSSNWCAGSGTFTPLTLVQGVNYTVENTGSGCTPAMATAYLQAWYTGGTECAGWGAIDNLGTNTISFNAPISGAHRIHVTSSVNVDNNTSCAFAKGWDGPGGASATLRYRQNTTVSNTTSSAAICLSDTKSLTATLGGDHNNPTINWSIVSGGGSISGTTYTPGGAGSVTVRATVGVCTSDVTFTVSPDRTVAAASATPFACNGVAMTDVTHVTTGVTGIASSSDLPPGVSASYSANTITIGGTPTTDGVYNYTIIPTGCGTATATGTITVITTADPGSVASATSATLAVGDLLWTGNTTSVWGLNVNWYAYDGTDFVIPGGIPTSSDRVFILPSSTSGICISPFNNTTVTASGSASDVFIGSGATMIIDPSQTLDVNGNWVNNGTFTPDASATVNFTGGTAQSIGGSSSNNFTNLTVNKSGNSLTLSTPISVSETLTMTSGNIVTSGANLLTVGTAPSTPGSVAWTNGTVVGPLRRYISGTASGTQASGIFPVGLSTVNRYAQVNYTGDLSTGGTITAEYKAGVCPVLYAGLPNTVNGQMIQNYEDEGYWEIEPNGGDLNTATYSLVLRGNQLSTVNSLAAMSNLRMIKSSGPTHASWDNTGIGSHNAPVGSETDLTITNTGLTGFSFFNIGSENNSPLPVKLTSFTASCISSDVFLKWTTESEMNSNKFVIERSRDLVSWTVIGEQQGAGNSNQTIHYAFTDMDPISGTSYYRLRQVDFDGEEELYGPISVDCENNSNAVKVYPNPTGSEFTVEINSLEESKNTTVQLTDVMGKVISSKFIDLTTGSNHVYFQETFESGTYLIRVLTATNEFETVKVVVKH